MRESPNLTALIVCSDERTHKWIEILLNDFSEIYAVEAEEDYQVFTIYDPAGRSIQHLPSIVDVIFFHSSPNDTRMWKQLEVKSKFTFEFNTPGTPQIKKEVLPIYRQTFPCFGVKPSDVDELVAFITEPQQAYPSMCIPPLEALPAVTILCQSYLEAITKDSTEIVAQPDWWLNSLGLLEQGILNQLAYQEILKRLEAEWESLNKPVIPYNGLERLINSFVIKQLESYEIVAQFIKHQDVVEAYDELTSILRSSNHKPIEELIDYGGTSLPKTIFAIRGDFIGTATAAAASIALGIKQQILEAEVIESVGKLCRESILVLGESQVSILPSLRLQNFAGAVLILSNESFSNLKRKYRVLRFGQGSHDALVIPFPLADLYFKVKTLVPMEQENLKFFQKEMEALKSFYKQEVIPCLQKLESPTGSLDSATEKIAALIEQTRTNTPVACHTVVKIGDETLQIQQHLRNALDRLREQKDLEPTVSYLQVIFQQWYTLVQSAAGENLKLAS